MHVCVCVGVCVQLCARACPCLPRGGTEGLNRVCLCGRTQGFTVKTNPEAKDTLRPGAPQSPGSGQAPLRLSVCLFIHGFHCVCWTRTHTLTRNPWSLPNIYLLVVKHRLLSLFLTPDTLNLLSIFSGRGKATLIALIKRN